MELEPVDLKTKSICIRDFGLFHHLAETLSESFGKVYYSTPWECASPKSRDQDVGSGFPNVERIQTFWDRLDDFDVIAYFDCYYGADQIHLEEIGKRVWGSRRGDLIETDRIGSKEYLASLGLSIGPYQVVKGLDDLREHLKHNKNKWVKTSGLRGDWESTHAKNYSLTEIELDDLAHILGRRKKKQEFIVEDSIPDAVEVAIDSYSIDGVFPTCSSVGIECKGQAYLGHFQPADKWPKPLVDINEKLAPMLEESGFRNFFAVEARITRDGTAWIVDPCCRASSPCSEMLSVMYSNLADIIWHGSEGVCIDPVPAGKWGAEIMLHSKSNLEKEQPIYIPNEFRKNIKLVNACKCDGMYYALPGESTDCVIGASVAVANSMEEAIEQACEYAESVEGPGICYDDNKLKGIREEIKRLKDFGITF